MSRKPADVERFLPLKPVVYHILLALADRDAHGYGVIRAVREQSGGAIQLQTGTFYRHLRRLLDDGFVEDIGVGGTDDDPRRGAYYRLTPVGLDVTRAEWRRMVSLVDTTRNLGISLDHRK